MRSLLAALLLFLCAAPCPATIPEPPAAQQTFPVAEDALITLDGRPCRLEDLPEGCDVEVTVEGGKVVRIVATTR